MSTARGQKEFGAQSRPVIDLESVPTWPDRLLAYLDSRSDIFIKQEPNAAIPAGSFDRAIYGLMDVLQAYSMVGWHCTRLTDQEIGAIGTSGMQLPDAAMLIRRIDTATEEGLLPIAVAERFKASNQAGEPNRAGMVWFCFFPPRIAGEGGIGDLLRFWGGEALYRPHSADPEAAAILRAIGTPSIVEAEVPIAFLEPHGGLAFKILRRFLISRGYETQKRCDHEDRIKQPLPANCIRRVVSFPHIDFLELSGCELWREPLKLPRHRGPSNG